ncbi:unnamed protein product [Brachionus calyciflorus]|uniref:Uncharacterized protein n=1 Tax=Brachionus calyciflorus TaxID=104777 RepID=A0A813SUZ3_9BILA|nr:unnamed protein product [Brachionus calyciflorus]
MILWLFIGIYQQFLFKTSMCLVYNNVNKNVLLKNYRKRYDEKKYVSNVKEILLVVTDDALVNNESYRDIINLSKNSYESLFLCNDSFLFDESKCLILNPVTNIKPSLQSGRNEIKIFLHRINSNLPLNKVKNLFDMISIRYTNKPHLNMFSIVLVANSNVIQLFKIIFNFSNYLIFYLDINKPYNYEKYKPLDVIQNKVRKIRFPKR